MQKIYQISRASMKHWREISFIYLVQLCVGLVIGFTVYSSFQTSFNGSMVLEQLAKGFDRTVFTDLLYTDSDALSFSQSMALPLICIYLMASVMLHAGWLSNIHNNRFDLKTFLTEGARLFFPFAATAILSILLVITFGAITGISFNNIVGDPRVSMSSEKPYVIWIMVLIGVFVLWSILVWSWSVASRYHYIDGKAFLASLSHGYKTVKANLLKFLAVGLLLVGIHILLMLCYYHIMEDRGAASWVIVVLGIAIQQVFAFVRLVVRGFGYAILDDLIF